MNAHRSLQRVDVLHYPVDKIALMIASEFLRAESRAQYPTIVQWCYHRARELMGILETLPLETEVALELSSIYGRCTEDQLMPASPLPSERIRAVSLELAAAFEKAAEHLKGFSHA